MTSNTGTAVLPSWHIRTASITSFQPPPSLPVLPTVVPVTDWEHGLLPLQFAVDPGPDLDWARSVQLLSGSAFEAHS